MHDSTTPYSILRHDALAGRLNRRQVLTRAMALGLSAPVIAGLLAACGGDDVDEAVSTVAAEPTTAPSGGAAPTTAVEPTGATAPTATNSATTPEAETSPAASSPTAADAGPRGGSGKISLFYWQAPVILNPHFAQGQKDIDASRIVLEPLFDYDVNTKPVLFLAVEWPTVENGLLDAGGRWVTWKLREGVKWHDGEGFDAEDVKFTWEFATDEATTATTSEVYRSIESVDIIDRFTVRLNFTASNPAWFSPFSGNAGMVLPEHLYRDYLGAEARNAPYNLQPIGTGPWRLTEFRPEDVAIYDIFEDYWEPGKPHFDQVELKGGGDATGAARAVLVSGEANYASNLQVEPAILEEMEGSGQGQIVSIPHNNVERICVNFADPNVEVDGARSEPTTQHPIWKHPEARQALNLSVQRDVIHEQLYGVGAVVTPYILAVPEKFRPPEITWEFNLDKARELLGSINFPDGFESRKLLFPSTVNSVRQKTQEIIKQDLEQLGFEVEIKAVPAAVFLSSDAGNPDTYGHFYSDIQEFGDGPDSPYPIAWGDRFRTDQIAQKANNWSGPNFYRYQNPEYDALHDKAKSEIDESKQIELWHDMLRMVQRDVVEVPIVWKFILGALSTRIQVGNPDLAFGSWAPKVVADLKNWSAA